jgi:ElaB/YqjD/DUF883 family membrane-anchored ribosome-binding protein
MNDFNATDGARTTGDGDAFREDDPEARVDQLTSEIDETRGDLTETIGAIGDKLDPANIAREASQTVRSATVGKVEQMTYGAQETWRDVRTGNTGSIVDTITSNPVPAGMVAVGLGLLFMNRGRQSRSQGNQYWNRYGDQGWTGGRPYENGGGSATDRVGSTMSGAGDRVGEVAGQAGRKVSEMTDSISQTAERLPQQAGQYMEQGGSQVRRFMDENPLGAGVIAFAAGATIGMLLPTTPMERDAIGPARDQLVDKVEGTVHQALDKVDQQVDGSQTYQTENATV